MLKKLLFLTLLAIGAWGQTQAQTVNIQGSVRIPGTTQGIPNQWVVLFINTGNPATSTMDSVLTDSTGSFNRFYTFNPGASQGSVTGLYVCNGVALYDSAFWSPANLVATLGFFCGNSPAPTGGWFCGNVQPLAAGDTAAISLYRLSGTQFVLDSTVYRWDSSGIGSAAYCLATKPFPAQYRISAGLTPGSVNFNNYDLTWLGNTRNINQALLMPQAGIGTTQLQPITLQPRTSNVNYIAGTVTGNTPANPLQNDTIRLILIRVQNNIWTPVDTFYTLDSMGFAPFYYSTSATGTYSILATLMSGNTANFVPTYFGNATTWSAASTFTLGSGNTVVISIALQAAGGTGGGGGSAGGGVNQGGLPITGSTGMQGVQLQLHNLQGQVLKAVHTNTQGIYNMSNLAFGNYKMHVEMMGMPFTAYPFTLSSSNPNAQLHFTVNQSGIAASLEQAGFNLNGVYPNPARDLLTISLSSQKAGELQIQLLDMTGREVLASDWQLTEGEGSKQLSLEGIPAGIYLLELRSNSGFAAQRVVIQ